MVKKTIAIQITGLLVAGGLYTQSAHAQEELAKTAFTECPSQAFLTQGKQPSTYAVNLITGSYNVIAADHGTKSPLNGVGFNTNDQFFYGWNYEHNEPARIHNDWKVEPLHGVNNTGAKFYVGDVSIVDNKYYVYRRGVDYGLYSIGLDPKADDYMKMVNVIDGKNLDLRIYDFAFHPRDGFAYAVDSSGFLYRINAANGKSENLGNVGLEGTLGATYFDVDGNLYLGQNSDGAIYRIAIDSGIYKADLFTMGPAASINDGSRCALAPLSDGKDTLVDYGDAPDSYGTSLAENGARHGLTESPTLFLGKSVDGESDSSFYPMSDDAAYKQVVLIRRMSAQISSTTGEEVVPLVDQVKQLEIGEYDDEDGVQFVTNIVENETSIALVRASGVGYLNAWIDFDRNGTFDAGEQIITDKLTSDAESSFYFDVPSGVTTGESWARFRISSTAGLLPTGGTIDGEVEDYLVKIQKQDVVVTAYPSPTDWTTVAFEDNWPFFGDYDMNDLVFYLRNTTYGNDAGISRVVIEGELAAAGASYHNGFAVRLPGVLSSEVDASNIEFIVNGVQIKDISPLEENRKEAIFIIANDIYDYVNPGENCQYYRSEKGCGSSIEMSFSISVPMKDVVTERLSGVLDPFMFATPGEWHGPQFSTPPGRGYEIHLKNQSPTEAFNQKLFDGIGQDASSPSNGIYFQSAGGMPWAIEVGTRWDYPLEFHEVTKAYPPFVNFAQSNGEEDVHWYDSATADPTHIFTD